MQFQELIRQALHARTFAYVPYSHFYVGAALLTKSGKVYTGCNIENIAFTVTNCAERTALFKAVSEGEQTFEAIAVVGGNAINSPPSGFAFPCGLCRQALAQFCESDFKIIVATSEENYEVYSFEELLPKKMHLELEDLLA